LQFLLNFLEGKLLCLQLRLLFKSLNPDLTQKPAPKIRLPSQNSRQKKKP
jgi:hypothetical protein